jgi:hypothetical protein
MDSSTKPNTGIKRIVIKWAQRIYVERGIELFHGEQELGENRQRQVKVNVEKISKYQTASARS